MQVALYFGSFNPIHLGHLAIARAVLDQTQCEELWFIVSPHNPLKAKHSLLDEEKRLSLLKIAIAKEEKMQVSDIEFSLPKPSYTLNTMQVLSVQYPNYDFKIVMGGDSFAAITKWKNYEELLANFDLIIYKREGSEVDTSLSNRLTILNVPLINISATTIRNKIKNNEPYRHLVSDSVWQKIEKTNYYK